MRIMACMLMLLFLNGILFPTAAWALTSGPAQPEFTSFEPVVTTNMVNDFTGDFTYNLPVLQVPGPDGGGYALSLSYHSGTSPEEEASWVGYGWTLNPGAINRQMRGIPDDWNGNTQDRITQWNKSTPSKTVSLGGSAANFEAFSFNVPASANASIRYNNYKGFGYSTGAGVALANGLINIGFNVTDGHGSFSLQVNSGSLLKKRIQKLETKHVINKEKRVNSNEKFDQDQKDRRNNNIKEHGSDWARKSYIGYGFNSLSLSEFPLNEVKYTGQSYTLSIGTITPTPTPLELGVAEDVIGQFNKQTNQESATPPGYGYLYSSVADGDEDAAMDYHVENLTTYNKRDKFLSIPFADADIFTATGEGISGSMRLYPRTVQHYRPAHIESKTQLFMAGAEFEAGLNNGGGATLEYGQQKTTVSDWNGSIVGAGGDEPYFFRMANDLGGYVDYGSASTEYDEPENAHVSNGGYSETVSDRAMDANERSGRSSYVGYNTNSEMGLDVGGNKYRSYEKMDLHTLGSPDVRNELPGEQIGELSVLNSQGQRYTYGLPVYASKDANLSFSRPSVPSGAESYAAHKSGSISRSEQQDADQFLGTESNGQYATSYLLTSITDANYVDRENNGPSPDDFGGYTQFIYACKHSMSTPYHWRAPYNGYNYNPGQLSECKDDMYSYSSGDKEVYYLDRIQTRTHVAKFILNSEQDERKDALGALPEGQSGTPAKLNYLDRIELYSRAQYDANPDDPGTPIKTVHFAYTYDAWPGSPNSTASNGGRLTLKSVWTDYNGVVNARIAPYSFDYAYPTDPLNPSTPLAYPSPYGTSIASAYKNTDQAPAYDVSPDYENTDPWGSYRANGDARADNMRPWIDQTEDPTAPTFDPAAWQLKKITLPSEGEIHIQYEPDDYLFVQDQLAHAMCKVGAVTPAPMGEHTQYTLDLADISPHGISSVEEANAVRDLIQKIYIDGNRKIYFKFLYNLVHPENVEFQPYIDINSKRHEFIDGYANVKNVYVNGTNVLIVLESGSGDNYNLPDQVCRSYYHANKEGKSLNPCGNTDTDPVGGTDGVQMIKDFVHFAVPDPAIVDCSNIDVEHSYFRIPLPLRKIGGGLRVKRLLMYDPQGVAAGHPRVYGSEYIYKISDNGHVVSSGVATNEPGSIREENALVKPLDRFNQSWVSRVIAGRDKKQSEGPLCEGMYPAPSVGYRQVIIKNINPEQETSPAFTVKQFYTALDYPVGWNADDDAASGADMTSIDDRHEELNLVSGLFNRIINKAWLSQGFTIKLNSMHGALRSETTYSGSTDPLIGASTSTGQAVRQSETDYDYFRPGEDIPVQTDIAGHVENKAMGKEVDIAIETRKVRDNLDDYNVEFDVDIATLVPLVIPFFSFMPGMTESTGEINTHVISKVVSYPAVLKRVRTHQDGIYHISENVAFDQYTGEPVQIRTNDGFLRGLANIPSLATATEGVYTQHIIPASYTYPDMGQAAKGEHKLILTTNNSPASPNAQVTAIMATVSGQPTVQLTPTPGGSICDALNAFCIGDLFQLSDPSYPSDPALYYLTAISSAVNGNNEACLDLQVEKASYSPSITAGASLANIFIVRSGCDNNLTAHAEEYTAYGTGEPVAATNDDEWNNRTEYVAGLNAAVAGLPTSNPSDPVDDPSPPPEHLSFVSDIGDGVTIHRLPLDGTLAIGSCRKLPPPSTGGSPFVLGKDGLIYYVAPGMDCAPILLDCPQFTAPHYLSSTTDQVVQCKASTFDDAWPYSDVEYPPTSPALTDYESGRKGHWRPETSYAYNHSVDQYDKNFNSGWFDLTQFNWEDPTMNDDQWVKASTVTAYSPDGQALEETNALGIPSCVRFGYDRTLPYLTAQNAERDNVLFESFEKLYPDNTYEAGLPQSAVPTRDLTVAHSGKASVRNHALVSGSLFTGTVNQRTAPTSQGTIIKAWFRAVDQQGDLRDPLGLTVTAGTADPIPMERVGRSGEWALYQAIIPPNGPTFSVSITCINAAGQTWMDDLRIQPVDAQMTAYVYDPDNLRLLTSFDDQHFGLYYQYNAEGKLVRKQVETEHGLKTIQETQYNTPLVDRP
jgi:hypothetical protein